MLFESPKKEKKIDNILQLTPQFKSSQWLQNSNSVTVIYYTYTGKNKTTNGLEKSLPLPRNASSTKIKSLLNSSLNKVYEISVNHSSLKCKLLFIYNQFNKGKNWIEQFELFCEKEKMDLSELKETNSIKTYTEKQSFIYSSELFWVMAIYYIQKCKNCFSIHDLIKLTHTAIDSVKNTTFILSKCYSKLVKQFKTKERLEFCRLKGIIQATQANCLHLLNDDKHLITKSDGSFIQIKNKQSKRVKLFNDINNVSIIPQENSLINQRKSPSISSFSADNNDIWF